MKPEKGILIYSVDVMICGLWHTWGVSELQQIHSKRNIMAFTKRVPASICVLNRK